MKTSILLLAVAACGITLGLSTGYSAAQVANPHANLNWNGPGTCLPCHEQQARAVHGSAHYQWEGVAPYTTNGPGIQGKLKTAVNSYCINITGNWNGCGACHAGLGAKPEPQPTQTQLENIDCLLCHQAGYKRVKLNGVFVPDTKNMAITMDQAVQNIHLPIRLNCVQCHAKGGGGDNYKRGDMAVAHASTADRNFDVHVAITGADLDCQACHVTTNHRIAGRGSDLRETDLDVQMNCSTSQCHPNKATRTGHRTSAVNRHIDRVACQTCHIKTYARDAVDTVATEGTEIYRNWLLPHPTPTGAIHPTPTLANNLKPVYRFWDKYSTNYSLFDRAYPDPATGRYPTSRPEGRIDDPTPASKLYPFKYKAALQPLAVSHSQLIALDTSVYFSTGDAHAATRSGLVNMGYSAFEPYEFVETDTYQLITHEVMPKSEVLTCSNCHGTTAQVDLKALGYALKGPQSSICRQCHSPESPESFMEMHKIHVTEEKYDCSFCHIFSRPERRLSTTLRKDG